MKLTALELADRLEQIARHDLAGPALCKESAVMLRELHAENEQLRDTRDKLTNAVCSSTNWIND